MWIDRPIINGSRLKVSPKYSNIVADETREQVSGRISEMALFWDLALAAIWVERDRNLLVENEIPKMAEGQIRKK